jgi:hypothetical protein
MLRPLQPAPCSLNLALDRGVRNEFKLGQESPRDYAAVSSANPIQLWLVGHSSAHARTGSGGNTPDGNRPPRSEPAVRGASIGSE